jgi:hypothetical protein
MRLNPLRRSQLVAPFGPGALHILEGGIAVLTGGLDEWFKDRSGSIADHDEIIKGKLIIHEPRLEELLGVSHFRVAPGPENRSNAEDPELVTPVYRFPTWFVCGRCFRMKRANLNSDGHITCTNKECKGARLRQMSFAAVCDHGHLQDFPWLEWVHRDSGSWADCANSLTYHAEGSGSLESIRIRCGKCNKQRSLKGVMQGDLQGSATHPQGWSGLSRFLRSKSENPDATGANLDFLCQGQKPWLGKTTPDRCERPLRAVLINATNVHAADVRSAIHIPPRYRASASRLAVILDEADFRSKIEMCRRSDDEIEDIARKIRRDDKRSKEPRLDDYSDAEIQAALLGHDESPPASFDVGSTSAGTPEEQEERIKREEFDAFLGSTDRDGRLVLRDVGTAGLPHPVDCLVEKIVAVEKLRETRVFAGFSRLLGRTPANGPAPSKMLWKNYPANFKDRWLPAAVVHGEGIFIRFNETHLAEWEARAEVIKRVAVLQRNQDSCSVRNNWPYKQVAPRFVLLHTIAHLLINRLVFECGYGSASLRERLYVSTEPGNEMAGLLIYTAAGDSEGTLGGLVSLAASEKLGKILLNAIEEAQWCSADPICGEAGQMGGQGPDSLNLAACHSCTLLPETSCENFNKLLDRGLVLRDPNALHSIFVGT